MERHGRPLQPQRPTLPEADLLSDPDLKAHSPHLVKATGFYFSDPGVSKQGAPGGPPRGARICVGEVPAGRRLGHVDGAGRAGVQKKPSCFFCCCCLHLAML